MFDEFSAVLRNFSVTYLMSKGLDAYGEAVHPAVLQQLRECILQLIVEAKEEGRLPPAV